MAIVDQYDPEKDKLDLDWKNPLLAPGSKVAKLPRMLDRGSVGPDVRALQRALRKAKAGPADGFENMGHYELRTAEAVKRFQKLQGLDADGVYGPVTHAKLSPFFDDWGGELMRRAGEGEFNDDPPPNTVRARIVEAAWSAYRIRDEVHYYQERPFEWIDWKDKDRVPRRMDCSEYASWCYWVAGAEDPNGLDWNGLGYTGTLCVNGRRISHAAAKPADLVFYGSSPPWGHVTIVVDDGDHVLSHGSELGPFHVPINYRPIGDVRTYL